MSNTEDTLDEIPIESAAIEMMLAHMVQVEQVFNIARPHLHPDQFNGMFEVAYHYIWAVTLEHYERYQELPSKEVLSSTVIAYMQRDATVPPDMLDDANSLIEWLWSEWAGKFSPDPAIKVVQAFLMDRKVKKQLDNLRIYGDSIPEVLQSLQDDTAAIAQIGNEDLTPTIGDIFPEYEQRVDQFRGRDLIGFRTGMRILDDRTCGIRGLIALGAHPGAGKTVFAMQIASGVARHVEENDAVTLYLSLDMARDDLVHRLICLHAGLDWKAYMLRPLEHENTNERNGHDRAIQDRIDQAKRLLRESGILDRISIVGRDEAVGLTTSRIVNMLRALLERTGTRNFLLVVDYLNLLEPPERDFRNLDVDIDRQRIRMVQGVLDCMAEERNGSKNAALVISETRKSPNSGPGNNRTPRVDDLMGSARLGYAADAVLLMRRACQVPTSDTWQDDSSNNQNDRDASTPLRIELAKGRDGMTCGSWEAEFLYRQSRIVEGLVVGPSPTQTDLSHSRHHHSTSAANESQLAEISSVVGGLDIGEGS